MARHYRKTIPEEGLIMQIKYLHVSAYPCDKCDGPVIAGSFGTRETEISRESALISAGAACLSCGNKPTKMNDGNVVRQFAPVEWIVDKNARAKHVLTTF